MGCLATPNGAMCCKQQTDNFQRQRMYLMDFLSAGKRLAHSAHAHEASMPPAGYSARHSKLTQRCQGGTSAVEAPMLPLPVLESLLLVLLLATFVRARTCAFGSRCSRPSSRRHVRWKTKLSSPLPSSRARLPTPLVLCVPDKPT